MKINPLLIAFVVLCSVSAGSAETASSSKDIQPLLIGASTPSVEVHTPDGTASDLTKLVDGERTVLIFYRGGW